AHFICSPMAAWLGGSNVPLAITVPHFLSARFRVDRPGPFDQPSEPTVARAALSQQLRLADRPAHKPSPDSLAIAHCLVFAPPLFGNVRELPQIAPVVLKQPRDAHGCRADRDRFSAPLDNGQLLHRSGRLATKHRPSRTLLKHSEGST